MDNKPKMDKKLTVLSELLNFEADKEFTIAEVIDRTEVNPQTVRTVLSRHSYLLEEAGKTETGETRRADHSLPLESRKPRRT